MSNKIKKEIIQVKGIRFSISDGENELARAFLYIMHNNLHREPFGLMEDVFVHPAHRGGGLGTELVKAVIEEARNKSCYKLIATSRHARDRVHKLYLDLGFEDWGKEFRMNF